MAASQVVSGPPHKGLRERSRSYLFLGQSLTPHCSFTVQPGPSMFPNCWILPLAFLGPRMLQDWSLSIPSADQSTCTPHQAPAGENVSSPALTGGPPGSCLPFLGEVCWTLAVFTGDPQTWTPNSGQVTRLLQSTSPLDKMKPPQALGHVGRLFQHHGVGGS